jgi:hypothetical protein
LVKGANYESCNCTIFSILLLFPPLRSKLSLQNSVHRHCILRVRDQVSNPYKIGIL